MTCPSATIPPMRGASIYHRSRRHAALRAAGAAVLAVTVAACHTSTMQAQPSPVAAAQPSPSTVTASTAPPTTAPATVGTTLVAGKVDLTLDQVIDPAQGSDSYLTPNAGERFVGVKFTIANRGTSMLSDDINSDVSIQGSDGQTYAPDFNPIAGCTNFNEGVFTITPGQAQTGCATFQIPDSVTPAQVQFSLTQGASTEVGQWKV